MNIFTLIGLCLWGYLLIGACFGRSEKRDSIEACYSKKLPELRELPQDGIGFFRWWAPKKTESGVVFVSKFQDMENVSFGDALLYCQVIVEKCHENNVNIIMSRGAWKDLLNEQPRARANDDYTVGSVTILPKFKYLKAWMQSKQRVLETLDLIEKEKIIRDVVT